MASAIGASEQHALTTYFDPSWGETVVAGLVDADAQREARWDAVTATRVPVGRVLTVLAGLGQAQLFAALDISAPGWPGATHHDAPPHPQCGYDPMAAAEATSALALAVHEAGPGAGEVVLEGRHLAQAHHLAAFAQLLATGRWATCRCCSPDERREVCDEAVRPGAPGSRRARRLPHPPGDRETLAPVVPLHHPGRVRSLPPL